MLIFATVAALPVTAKGLFFVATFFGGGGLYAHMTDPRRPRRK
jgi:hypothetical protein